MKVWELLVWWFGIDVQLNCRGMVVTDGQRSWGVGPVTNHWKSFAERSLELQCVHSSLLWGHWSALREGHIALYKSTRFWTLMLSWEPAHLLLISTAYPEAKYFLGWLWTNCLTISTGLVFSSHVPFMSHSVWNMSCTGFFRPVLVVVPLLLSWIRKGPLATFLCQGEVVWCLASNMKGYWINLDLISFTGDI